MALTDADRQMYQELELMFNSKGWEHLTKGFQAELDNLPDMAFYNAKSLEELERYRIRAELLEQLIELPADIAEAREALEQEEPESDV